MLKTIKSFFQPLTREQLEQKTLSDMQEARLRKELHLHVSNEIVDLVSFDGVINVDNDIGDAVITAFD